ncbi:hypothetical protein DES49_2678 [Halospina denitrificans]|uniref:Uncharacterized protein n=1 Tax=Halospina denitrificans TaxID=332522 RepID=A0A4R7JIJ7_9GAMM|nr:hypothetical protein [Halospina denitrificans]TDT37720.1 hypothetical protein DES49_2678 [Halospina denitrificans]
MSTPTFEFLRNDAGEEEGLGDAGIETFRDAPYSSCAREAGQNSRDAARDFPVRMTFDVLWIDRNEVPAFAKLESAFQACLKQATQEKEHEFFNNANKVIKRTDIPVLKIADYNTKGLTGPPDQSGTPFRSLLKGSGVSAKDSETSGGSFGIGKNASFAVSDLQTVFYSTLYEDPHTHEPVFAAQGKVRLISHINEDGKECRATGYWGLPEQFRAVTDVGNVPEWMRRSELGTSIFCLGFRETDEWALRMTASLVSNFFCAIHRGEMIFHVDSGAFRVNDNTVEGLLTDSSITEAADKGGHKADLEFAAQLYRCLVSDQTIHEVLDIPDLGKMKVSLLTEEQMPRRVGFVRNGMLITDNLRHFGEALARFPGSRDFIVLVEPDDDEAGKLLKRLENPSHDGFSAQRISDAEFRKRTYRAMKKLAQDIRKLIKDKTGVSHEGAVELDELSRFFAEGGKTDRPPDPEAEEDPEKFTYQPKPRKRKRETIQSPNSGEQGGQGGSGGSTEGPGGGVGPGSGYGSGGSGDRGTSPTLKLSGTRNQVKKNAGGDATSRLVHFTPENSGHIRLRFCATGMQSPEYLKVTDSDKGEVYRGDVYLEAEASTRCSLRVSFDKPYEGPIELVATLSEVEESAE